MTPPLTPERVRELTACYRAPEQKIKRRTRRASASTRPRKLTDDKIAAAERMVYVEGKTFKEASQFAGCSLSRIYRVLSLRRAAKREGGAA